ncbi:MAG: peptidylprolyl isomerase [Elusimicrobia bacterium]|nr:peptidylprolyl isomerase [Elusimicrobiota bacterium]
MKIQKSSVLSVIFCLAAIALLQAEKIVDRVVARVNDEVILLSEFNLRSDQITSEYEKILTGPDKDKKLKELRTDILEQMIDEKLLLQKAEKDGIHVTNAEIDQGIDEIRGRFASEVEFQNEISKQGLTGEGFRENVEKQLKVIKLINQNVKAKIEPPTEDEVRKYYDENEAEMMSPEQIRAKHILVRTSEETSQEEAKKKIDKIYEEVKKDPEKFSSFAEKYSEGPSASLGGDLGYFARGDMVKEFEDVAFGMEVGELSKPVKTRFGYHIIKLVGKKSSEKRTYAEVKDRLRNLLYQMQMEKAYEEFLRNLRDEAKISKTLDQEPADKK